MITFQEMRTIADLREWNEECRSKFRALHRTAIRAGKISEANLADAMQNTCKAIDYLIELIERETDIPCNRPDIEQAEHIHLVVHGKLKRNMG